MSREMRDKTGAYSTETWALAILLEAFSLRLTALSLQL